MRDTCIEHELICPVLKFVCLPAELIIKHEVVIRPFQTFSYTCGKTIDLHILIVVEDIEGKIRVGLAGIVQRHVQRRRLLAEEPWLRETCRKAGIICTVGLETHGKILGITERNRSPRCLVKETAGREVVEAYSDSSHKRISSPTSRKLKLAGRLLRHIIYNVDCVVHLIRDNRISLCRVHDGLRVELSH